MSFIDLDVLYVCKENVIGIAKTNLAATYAAPECFNIIIYIKDYKEPIIIPYLTQEERDTRFEEVKTLL